MEMYLKKILFSLVLIGTVACSSDDDTTIVDDGIAFEEKIIGDWQLIERMPGSVEYCELSNTIQFREDQELTLHFFTGDVEEECQGPELDGEWEYLGDNRIQFNLNGFEDNAILEINFSANNTRMEIQNISDEENDIVEVFAKQ